VPRLQVHSNVYDEEPAVSLCVSAVLEGRKNTVRTHCHQSNILMP
jgi:hypothetical protein